MNSAREASSWCVRCMPVPMRFPRPHIRGEAYPLNQKQVVPIEATKSYQTLMAFMISARTA